MVKGLLKMVTMIHLTMFRLDMIKKVKNKILMYLLA
ncbi:hypothetical protein ESCOCK400B_19000 [Escherichia coli]